MGYLHPTLVDTRRSLPWAGRARSCGLVVVTHRESSGRDLWWFIHATFIVWKAHSCATMVRLNNSSTSLLSHLDLFLLREEPQGDDHLRSNFPCLVSLESQTLRSAFWQVWPCWRSKDGSSERVGLVCPGSVRHKALGIARCISDRTWEKCTSPCAVSLILKKHLGQFR